MKLPRSADTKVLNYYVADPDAHITQYLVLNRAIADATEVLYYNSKD